MDTTLSRTSTTLLQDVACGGNPHAERLFCDRYGRLARIVARVAGVHENDLDDVVQETVSAAVQGLREKRYDRPRAPFKAWFKGILFHRIGSLRRGQARRAGEHSALGTAALDEVPDPQPGPAEQVEAAFEAEWQRALLEEAADEVRQRVDPVNWQAYDLVEQQGHKPAAAARMLGIRRSQVYNAVSRVKAHLREVAQELSCP